MGAKTGKEFLEKLRGMKREIYLQGEKVEDVTSHPTLSRTAATMARLYDMQLEPDKLEEMTFEENGERFGLSFLVPRTIDDLVRRRTMMKHWADYSGGMLGRTPDYVSSSLMAFSAAADYFGEADPRFGENVKKYYENVRQNDLCLTHTLINPQANRSVETHQQADPYLAAGILEETNEGIVIRGCRMLATLAPFSEAIQVFPSTLLKASNVEDAKKYSYAFTIPCDLPGLKFICRESFDIGRSRFDHPLSSRFEEMDCVVIFDDVLVPWENVFMVRDVERCNNAYGATNAVVHMAHQVIVKNVAKAEFLLGVCNLLAETIAITEYQHVQEKLAEIITYTETMRACLRASEADAKLDKWGMMTPARPPLDTARNMFPRMYPRIVEILQLLGASGFMAIPTEADMNGELRPYIDKYYQARTTGGYERVKLFRLAWDIACSSWGGRQVLYERFFFGDPVRMMSMLYYNTDKKAYMDRVRNILEREEIPYDLGRKIENAAEEQKTDVIEA